MGASHTATLSLLVGLMVATSVGALVVERMISHMMRIKQSHLDRILTKYKGLVTIYTNQDEALKLGRTLGVVSGTSELEITGKTDFVFAEKEAAVNLVESILALGANGVTSVRQEIQIVPAESNGYAVARIHYTGLAILV